MRLTLDDFQKRIVPGLIADAKSALKQGQSLKTAVHEAATKFFEDNEVIGEGDQRLTAEDIDITVNEPKRKTAVRFDLTNDNQADDGMAGVVNKAVKDALKANASDFKRVANVTADDDGDEITVPASAHRTRVTAFKRANAADAQKAAYGFGRFMMAVQGDRKSYEWCRAKGFIEGNIYAGGAFVPPPEFMADIIDLRDQYGVFPQNTRHVMMSRDTMQIPKITGGATAYFVGEATSANATNADTQLITLTAKKLMAHTIMSSEVNEDAAISVGNVAAEDLARAFAYKIDYSAFIGDGSSTYPILGYKPKLVALGGTPPQIVAATSGTATNWGSVTLNDLAKVRAGLSDAGEAAPSKKWFCNKNFYFSAMNRLELAAGGNGKVDLGTGPVYAFNGDPVVFVNVLPATASTAEIVALYGDLSVSSFMGDRRDFTIEMSREAVVPTASGDVNLWGTDQMAIRATQRLDIYVHDVGTATASGTVAALKTAS